MATAQYTALANITLGSTASSVTFGSIPNTYRDLMLVTNSSISSGAAQVYYRFNTDSGSNYSSVFMEGTGSVAQSSSQTTTQFVGSYYTNDATTAISNSVLNVMDYAATDKHKTSLLRTNNAGILTVATASRWANTGAVTTITVGTSASTFGSGSTFALYGVK